MNIAAEPNIQIKIGKDQNEDEKQLLKTPQEVKTKLMKDHSTKTISFLASFGHENLEIPLGGRENKKLTRCRQ